MHDSLLLPLVKPVYSTYHYQGNDSGLILTNPSLRNRYLNEVFILNCTRRFLRGYTSPELDISRSSWDDNPHLYKKRYSMEFLGGYVNPLIRELLNQGFYVFFWGVDDYYVEGKTWYQERHFSHDGLICGYDQKEKTYSLYAYDKNWIYRVFSTPQKAFNDGRRAMARTGIYGEVCGLKPKEDILVLNPALIRQKLLDYLDSSFTQYAPEEEGTAYGIVVHDYLGLYLDRLQDGSIPYDRMDRRIFRLLWEQKVLMQERLERVEEALELPPDISRRYRPVLEEAAHMRMLYASHHMRRRDSLLPVLRQKLLWIRSMEEYLLTEFIFRMGGALSS